MLGLGVGTHWPGGTTYTGISSTITYITATGSGTWNKPAGLLFVDIIAIAGGGGGGAGRMGPDGANACGGIGGNDGCLVKTRVLASSMAVSENYYIGNGGLGGAAITGAVAANGNAGNAGEDTYFGTHVIAKGGLGGNGGGSSTTTTVQATQLILNNTPASTYGFSFGSQATGSTNTTGGSLATSGWNAIGTCRFIGGGNGGGLNTTNVQTNGGPGGRFENNTGGLPSGSSGGVAPGGAGSSGAANHLTRLGLIDSSTFTIGKGLSGSGGASANTASGVQAGAGGDGALYGGAGGGGGAGRLNLGSGKGGDGAQGLLIIIEYFLA